MNDVVGSEKAWEPDPITPEGALSRGALIAITDFQSHPRWRLWKRTLALPLWTYRMSVGFSR